MILSSVAPEKHQHLVCCVYSEVTISKNSFLKNCPRWLGSTQAEWWASGRFSCLRGSLEAGSVGQEYTGGKKAQNEFTCEGYRCPGGLWQAGFTKPYKSRRLAGRYGHPHWAHALDTPTQVTGRRQLWMRDLFQPVGGRWMRVCQPLFVFRTAQEEVCVCVYVCLFPNVLKGVEWRQPRFGGFFPFSSSTFYPYPIFQFLVRGYHF